MIPYEQCKNLDPHLEHEHQVFDNGDYRYAYCEGVEE